MNQLHRWILCAALCCVVSACDSQPKNGDTGQGDSAGQAGKADSAGQAGKADSAGQAGKADSAGQAGKADSAGQAGEADNAGQAGKTAKDGSMASGVAISMNTPSDVAAPPADAKKTKNGIAYVVLQAGRAEGKSPRAWDNVKVHYSGWTTDGKLFDSSLRTGQPAEFPLHAVIPGWTEGVQVMKEGEAVRFWIPGKLAYDGAPNRPQGMLVFDIELLEVKSNPKPPAPPETPSDVAAAPKDAKRTAKGVSYKVLKAGTGTVHPKATDQVEVHYSGWTTDGKMFDSSVKRGQTATFPLNGVIAGWTDGLQTMVVGEKTRFWIPSHMAYNNAPGRPMGMLVFDVELIDIK